MYNGILKKPRNPKKGQERRASGGVTELNPPVSPSPGKEVNATPSKAGTVRAAEIDRPPGAAWTGLYLQRHGQGQSKGTAENMPRAAASTEGRAGRVTTREQTLPDTPPRGEEGRQSRTRTLPRAELQRSEGKTEGTKGRNR